MSNNESEPRAARSRVPRVQLGIVAFAVVIGLGILAYRTIAASTTSSKKTASPSVVLSSAHPPTIPARAPWLPQENPPEFAAREAQPLLEKLKEDPKNFDLLTQAGNIYLHSRVFSGAVEFYEQALQLKDEVTVRNDYANALYYSGNTDRALAQYEAILKSDPTNANALFNRGMVRWRAKQDASGAVASWKLLLKAYPHHPRRSDIEHIISQVGQHVTPAK